MLSTSLVLLSLILSSLILHHRLLEFFFRLPRTTSLTDVRDTLSLVFVALFGEIPAWDTGDAVSGVGRRRGVEILEESDSRAERATDRTEAVSGSRRADVSPAALVVIELDPDVDAVVERGRPLPFRNDSPEDLPLVNGSDAVDSADVGDRNSGVEERALGSAFASSSFC